MKAAVPRLGRSLPGLLLAAALLLAGCTGRGPAAPAPTTLRIAGSTSMAPLLADLAEAYQAAHSNVLIDLRAGGSAVGISELQAGLTDLAAVSWQQDGSEPPEGLQAVAVGRDAITIIVHPRNPTPGLTLLQARALYRGDTLDWEAVGGAAGQPVIVSREDGSGTRGAFEALVMEDNRVTLNGLVMPNSRAVVDYVASHRTAVGYVSLAWVDERVRVLPVEDTVPVSATVRSGAYYLTRTLYLYAPRAASSAAQSFLDFVLSPAGQAIVAQRHTALR